MVRHVSNNPKDVGKERLGQRLNKRQGSKEVLGQQTSEGDQAYGRSRVPPTQISTMGGMKEEKKIFKKP